MLKGISPLISPDLLATLSRMGHGDEIVLADAHFPGESINPRCLRADGIKIAPLLDGILSLLAIDSYADDSIAMMAPVSGDQADPAVEASYSGVLSKHLDHPFEIAQVERFAFYERAKGAFAVVMTGDTAKYGNLLLKKGVTPSTDL